MTTPSSLPTRPGMTVPLPGPLHSHREQLAELVELGYTDIWSAEADSSDGFTPLALAAAWEPRLRLGTAIVPAFTRSPACFAQCVASLADAAPGRFAIGIGTSSNVIVERWNGIPFVEPYKKVRDIVRFLRDALTGEKVTATYDTFDIKGFRLGIRPEQAPPILVAGLREGMLRLAGREADGAIINWLSPEDVATVAPVVLGAADGAEREIVARVFVCPSENVEAVRAGARYVIAAYLNVPVYAEFHRWLGRGDELQGMWDAWAAGDRKAAMAAIPDSVVDALVVHGSPEQCRKRLQAYFDNGVTTSSLAILGFDPDVSFWEAARALAPRQPPRTRFVRVDGDPMDTLSDAIARLQAEGYTGNWFATDDHLLECSESGAAADPATVTIEHTVRFEGQSDPDDEVILYALSEPGGRRGVYSAPYGSAMPAADVAVIALLRSRSADDATN